MGMKDFGTISNGNKMETKLGSINLKEANQFLKEQDPLEIIQWVLNMADNPILTTNFGPYSASLIHAVTRIKNDISVIWCDTGYNTPHTYRYAKDIMKDLSLNMHIYTPKFTTGFLDVTMGIPEADTDDHQIFTEKVKLEPFKRALNEHNPDVWFTNLRQDQTEFRKNLDILHVNNKGILKVSPFYYYTEFEMDLYLQRFNLPNEKKYFDPTKVLATRECGLHL